MDDGVTIESRMAHRRPPSAPFPMAATSAFGPGPV